jgi:Trk-type K+ transport system membrane component
MVVLTAAGNCGFGSVGRSNSDSKKNLSQFIELRLMGVFDFILVGQCLLVCWLVSVRQSELLGTVGLGSGLYRSSTTPSPEVGPAPRHSAVMCAEMGVRFGSVQICL